MRASMIYAYMVYAWNSTVWQAAKARHALKQRVISVPAVCVGLGKRPNRRLLTTPNDNRKEQRWLHHRTDGVRMRPQELRSWIALFGDSATGQFPQGKSLSFLVPAVPFNSINGSP